MADPSDSLTRAIELSIEFEKQKGERDVETFLQEHADLREILEPLLTQNVTPDERQVLGDFELVRELGRGGMGVVYEAIQTLLGRTVALKLLPPHRALSPRSLAMFRREATLAASLDHPGIAKVLEFQEVDGQLALAMELVDGRPLDDILESLHETLPDSLHARDLTPAVDTAVDGDTSWSESYEAAAVELTRQVAHALAHAHSRGVIHRDIKPGNILITSNGTAVLTDFGLAREEGMKGVTNTGEFAGTYRYSAPEQLEGRLDEIDGRTDIYALGATLYELLTLHHPIDAESITEMIHRIRHEDPTAPSKLNPRINSDLDAVVLCALEKDRNRRYSSAEEFASDLAHVLNRTPVKARRLSAPGRATRWVRRNRLVSVFVAVLIISTASISLLAATTAHAEQRATDHLQKYQNISVGAALDAVEARADATHPPWPEHTDELRQLSTRAKRLLSMRSTQEAAVADLRRDNTLAAPAPRAAERPPHPATRRIDQLRGSISQLTLEATKAAGVSDAAKRSAIADVVAMERELSELTELVRDSNRVDIGDANASALHDRLEHQLYRLRNLESILIPDLQFRLDWSERVRQHSIEDHAAEWKAVAERVAQSDGKYGSAFADAPLAPQLGLVPLGPDPKSGLEEFGHLSSGDLPKRVDGSLRLGERSGIVFVLMPGGSYSPPTTRRPVEEWTVELDPFFIAKHETNRAQWQRLARNLPGLRWRDGGVADVRNHGQLQKPVNGITWLMCDKLLTRYALDLPTATQWDYAMRYGGTIPKTAEALAATANLLDRAYARGQRAQGLTPPPVLPFDDRYYGLAPITSMEPNPAGLHHLLGNVSEWCRDRYLGKMFRVPPRIGDGLRPIEAGENAHRMLCGGHWQGTTPALMYDRRVPSGATRSSGVRPVRRVIRGDG